MRIVDTFDALSFLILDSESVIWVTSCLEIDWVFDAISVFAGKEESVQEIEAEDVNGPACIVEEKIRLDLALAAFAVALDNKPFTLRANLGAFSPVNDRQPPSGVIGKVKDLFVVPSFAFAQPSAALTQPVNWLPSNSSVVEEIHIHQRKRSFLLGHRSTCMIEIGCPPSAHQDSLYPLVEMI